MRISILNQNNRANKITVDLDTQPQD